MTIRTPTREDAAAIADICNALSRDLYGDADHDERSVGAWFGLSDQELAEAYPYEDWILARSLVGEPAPGEVEDDLFAGIRVPVRQ